MTMEEAVNRSGGSDQKEILVPKPWRMSYNAVNAHVPCSLGREFTSISSISNILQNFEQNTSNQLL